MAYLYGWLGALVGLGIPLIVRLVLHLHKIRNIHIVFDYSKLIELLKGGIRLFVSSIANTIYRQVDSLITVAMLGPTALGIYGIAQTINSFIYGVFGATIQPVGQRMLKSANNEKLLRKYLNVLLLLSSYAMVFPIIAIVLATPFLVDSFIPQFHDSINLVRILAVAAFFNLTIGPINGYMYAKRLENKITVSTLVAGGINLVLDIYLISEGYGILGVAYATSFSYLINFILLNYLANVNSAKDTAKYLIPLFYLVVILNLDILIGVVITIFYLVLLMKLFKDYNIFSYVLSNFSS